MEGVVGTHSIIFMEAQSTSHVKPTSVLLNACNDYINMSCGMRPSNQE